jgi:hypothetical protein
MPIKTDKTFSQLPLGTKFWFGTLRTMEPKFIVNHNELSKLRKVTDGCVYAEGSQKFYSYDVDWENYWIGIEKPIKRKRHRK